MITSLTLRARELYKCYSSACHWPITNFENIINFGTVISKLLGLQYDCISCMPCLCNKLFELLRFYLDEVLPVQFERPIRRLHKNIKLILKAMKEGKFLSSRSRKNNVLYIKSPLYR